MKSFLKFTLLAALLVGGKLAKQPVPAATAQAVETNSAADTTVVMVHQVFSSEPVKPTPGQAQAQQDSGALLAEIF